MGCRISHRQAHPPARTAAESDDIDVRFIAEAVRAAVSRVIRPESVHSEASLRVL